MKINRAVPFLFFVSLAAAAPALHVQNAVQPEVHEITVEGETVPEYTARESTTATKTDTPLLDTP